MSVEHGTFTPLVFSLTGCKGPKASMFHKYSAQKISPKTEEKYDRVLSLIRCSLSFLILRSVLICVRESRSVSNDHVHLNDVSLTGQAAGLSYVFVDLMIERQLPMWNIGVAVLKIYFSQVSYVFNLSFYNIIL